MQFWLSYWSIMKMVSVQVPFKANIIVGTTGINFKPSYVIAVQLTVESKGISSSALDTHIHWRTATNNITNSSLPVCYLSISISVIYNLHSLFLFATHTRIHGCWPSQTCPLNLCKLPTQTFCRHKDCLVCLSGFHNVQKVIIYMSGKSCKTI